MINATFQTMPEKCETCTLRGSTLCRIALAACMTGPRRPHLRRFDRDTTIIREGDAARFAGVLCSGYLRKERFSQDGRRIILGLASPGDLVGGLPGETIAFSQKAATDAEILVIDPLALRQLMDADPRVRAFVLQEAARQRDALLRMTWQRGALTSRERIIAFLVEATEIMPVERQDDGSLILTMELTRRDWADLSNTSVESISRVLTWLAEKTLVTKTGPAQFRIRDPDALAQLAGIDPPLPDRVRSRTADAPARPRVAAG